MVYLVKVEGTLAELREMFGKLERGADVVVVPLVTTHVPQSEFVSNTHSPILQYWCDLVHLSLKRVPSSAKRHES